MKAGYLRVLIAAGLILAVAACSGPTAGPESGTGEGAQSIGEAQQGAGTLEEAGEASQATGERAEGAPGETPNLEAVEESLAESIEPLSAITETETYTDEVLGYAIDYPAAWTIEAVPGSIVTLRSFDPEEHAQGGIMPGETQIDIVPDLSEAETPTLEELVAATVQAGGLVDRQDIELAGGIPAVRLHMRTSANVTGEALMLVAVIGETGIRVQGFGEAELFDPIARSLRAAEGPSEPDE